MVGLSSAPEGADAPVDHKKSMEKAHRRFETRQEWPVNEEAYKQLEGDERQIADDWRNMSDRTRNELVDGLIKIDDEQNAENVELGRVSDADSGKLKTLRDVEKVLKEVFGVSLNSVMDNRRVALREEGELQEKIRLEGEEGKMVLKKLDDDLERLPSEAEGSQLDGTTQIDEFKKPE